VWIKSLAGQQKSVRHKHSKWELLNVHKGFLMFKSCRSIASAFSKWYSALSVPFFV